MAEIRRSPVEVGSLSHDLQGFSTIPGGDRRISEPSTVGNSEPLTRLVKGMGTEVRFSHHKDANQLVSNNLRGNEFP